MFGISSIVKALALVTVVLTVAFSFWYISGLRADLAVSQENSKRLITAVEDQKIALASLIADQNKIREINITLNSNIRKQQEDLTSLRDKLTKSADGSSRDIAKIAKAKPIAFEKIINNASNKSIRCMEIASGSILTKDEQNEKNSECPSLTGISK